MAFENDEDDIVGSAQLKNTKGISIKIIGAGGAGGNSVSAAHKDFYTSQINDNQQNSAQKNNTNNSVEFMICNTDIQALRSSGIKCSENKLKKILLGPEFAGGLGAGGIPEKGKRAAEESKKELQNFIEGADIVIIVAGMGGGTGTGSVSIISQVAKEMNILSVVICSTPFTFEGMLRQKRAMEGIDTFKQNADSYIIINNEDLIHNMQTNGNLREAFAITDSVLLNVLRLFIAILFNSSLINIDLADVINCMQNQGQTFIGIGNSHKQVKYISPNQNRIHDLSLDENNQNNCEKATLQALSHPLLKDEYLQNASNLIIHILVNDKTKFEDIIACVELIKKQINNNNVNVVFGAGLNTEETEEVEVLIIATGITDKQNPENINIHTTQMQSSNNENTQLNMPHSTPHNPSTTNNTANTHTDNQSQSQSQSHLDIPAFFRRQSFMKNDFNKFKK